MRRVYVEGLIVPDEDQEMMDYFGYPCMCPRKLRMALEEADGDDVELWINSYGGDVWAAMAMYADLQSYPGGTIAFVTGLCASAATIILCGCDMASASIGAQLMVHNASTSSDGDYHDMYTSAEQLKTADDAILAVYVKRTGKSYDELKAYMERTTWFSAQTALEIGFVDEVADFSDQRLIAGVVNVEDLRAQYQAVRDKQDASKEAIVLERERYR